MCLRIPGTGRVTAQCTTLCASIKLSDVHTHCRLTAELDYNLQLKVIKYVCRTGSTCVCRQSRQDLAVSQRRLKSMDWLEFPSALGPVN